MPLPGHTNNPNGRPPKSKSLTDLLDKALSRTWDVGGKKKKGKAIVADLVADALVTGRFRFPSDSEDNIISVKDWLEFVKWAYERLDGKPVQPIAGDEDRGPVVLRVVYDTPRKETPDA